MAQPQALPPPLERPGAESGPTQVFVTAWFADISKVDSVAQTFSANVGMLMRWKDPSLAHLGPGPKTYPLEDIWNPRMMIANAGSDLKNTLPETVEVTPEGTVYWRQRLIGSFSNSLNLSRFPFDSEVFKIEIVAGGNQPNALKFLPDPKSVEDGLASAVGRASSTTIQDWRVTKTATRAVPYQLSPGVKLVGYEVSFSATRLSEHYVLKVMLPLILIVLMAFSVFWIDPTLGSSQISVSVTSMLTLIAYRFALGADTPKLPYLTLMDAFILLGTVLVFLSLVEVLFTTRLALNNRVDVARRLDRISRFAFPVVFAVLSIALFLFW